MKINLSELVRQMKVERERCCHYGVYGTFQIDFAKSICSHLSCEQLQRFFETGEVQLNMNCGQERYNLSDYVEAQNVFRAVDYLLNNLSENFGNQWDQDIHKILAAGLYRPGYTYEPGKYRTKQLFYKSEELSTVTMEKAKRAYELYEKATSLDNLIEAYIAYQDAKPFELCNEAVNRLLFIRRCFDLKFMPPSFCYFELYANHNDFQFETVKEMILTAQAEFKNQIERYVLNLDEDEVEWFDDICYTHHGGTSRITPKGAELYAENYFQQTKENVWTMREQYTVEGIAKKLSLSVETVEALLDEALQDEDVRV